MRRLALCTLIVICATPLSARTGEIDAAIARYVGWRGGAAFLRLRSIQRTGQISAAGLTGSISQLERRDGYRRIDYDLGAVKGSETVTPSDAWTTSGSGQIEDLGESLARDAKRALAHECGRLLRRTHWRHGPCLASRIATAGPGRWCGRPSRTAATTTISSIRRAGP